MSVSACALGVRTPELDANWRAFVKAARPWAFILFREACVTPAQVRRLTDDLRAASGRDVIIYIDQEGGRVARMRAPHWPIWPAAAAYGALFARDPAAGLEAAKLGHRLIAHELRAAGVNGDFAPVLDTPVDGADLIIGDRAFAQTSEAIVALAKAALEGLHNGGVAGCIKHMPGHGRAAVDSHLALPRVVDGLNELGADFAPFRALADAEMAMTAHIVFAAVDPEQPVTHSATVIRDIIRGALRFDGLLASDDLDMKALSGPLRQKAEKAFAAGCDIVLQCNGVIADMEEVAAVAPVLSGAALKRAARVEAIAQRDPIPFDAAAGWWRLRRLMGEGVGLRLS
ncbi:MAG: beta-N-acetylhexosaminidase [Alphaproteobacteria bacterium]|nr:beta-N-acetylhexosaminidase [Alphaproteobacteria bacterium]